MESEWKKKKTSQFNSLIQNKKLVPGGGAIELAVSQALMEKAASIEGVQQWSYRDIANALEIIPRTLAQNCGAKVVRLLTELKVLCFFFLFH